MNNSHIVKKMLDEFWLQPISVVVLFFVTMFNCLVIVPKSTDTLVKADLGLEFWLKVLALCGIYFCYIFLVYKSNTIKKNKGKLVGILWVIDADNKVEFDDTKRKLGETFKDLLSNHFNVIFVPYHRGTKIKKMSDEQQKKLLISKRCTLVVHAKILVDMHGQENYYDISVSTGILHSNYEENIKKLFLHEYVSLFKKLRNFQFKNDKKIEFLRLSADKLALACSYIIGVSMLYNGSLNIAQDILDDLHNLLLNKEDLSEYENSILHLLEPRIYDLHILLSEINSLLYQNGFDKVEYLNEMNVQLEAANKIISSQYEYYLNKAFYHVIYDQNIAVAKECIENCKKSTRKEWRYSDAFISAYNNNSPSIIFNKYNRALKYEYNLLYLIDFIESYLQIEPDRYGLHFALGLLYNSVGDTTLAEKSFLRYSSEYSNPKKLNELLRNRCGIILE